MKLWTDSKIKKLTKDQALFWFYLLTGPNSHMSGLYRLPVGYVVLDLNFFCITEDDVISHLRALEHNGLIMYDTETETVYVKKMAEYQGSMNNKNYLKGLASHVDDIQDSETKTQYMIDYSIPFGHHSDTVRTPFEHHSNTIRTPSEHRFPPEKPQDQDQDQKQDQKQKLETLSLKKKSEEEKQPEVTIIGSSPATRFGDIQLPVRVDPSPSTVMLDRGNPWTVELRELQQLYADVTKTQIDPHPVTLDLRKRMCRALDCYGLDGCQKAILGLYRLSSKEGSQRVMSLPKCFPEGAKSGRKRSDYLDQSLFVEFIAASPPSKKEKLQKEQEHKQKDSALVAPPSDEQIQKNLELIRETKRKLRSWKK